MRRVLASLVPALLVFLFFRLTGCGKDSKPTSCGDEMPPGAVTDLVGAAVSDSTVLLVWTAPGDDDTSGTASRYDIRRSTLPDSLADWWDSLCVSLDSVPIPKAAGEEESLLIGPLETDTVYSFALRSADEVPNWSGLSNVVHVTCGSASPGIDSIPPAAVTDLGVLSVAETAVTITWTSPGDDSVSGTAAAYDIRYSTTGIDEERWEASAVAPGAPVPERAGSAETFTISDLAPDTTYWIALRASDEAGNVSGLSNVMSARTAAAAKDTIPPARIPYLHAAARGPGRAFLIWIAPGDDGTSGRATGYDIRHSESPINEETWATNHVVPSTLLPGPPGSLDSLNVLCLDEGWRFFALRAFDEAGNYSPISPVALALIAHGSSESVPPGAIEDLKVVDVVANEAKLAWTAPGDDGMSGTAGSYDVRFATDRSLLESWNGAESVAVTPPPAAAGTPETLVVRNLLSRTTHYFGIKTKDRCGNWSELSNIIEAMTGVGDTIPPAAVSDLSLLAYDERSVLVGWTSPGDDGMTGTAYAYDVRRSTSPLSEDSWGTAVAVPGAPRPASAGSRDSLSIRSLTFGTTYYIALKTRDTTGLWSDLSNVVAATPGPDVTPPGTITDLHFTSLAGKSVRLGWTAPREDGSRGGPSRQYDLRFLDAPLGEANWEDGVSWGPLSPPSEPGTLEDVLINGLTPGTRYFFAVRAMDDAMNLSGLSNVVDSTLMAVYAEPDSLDFGASGDTAEIVVSNPGDGAVLFLKPIPDSDWIRVRPGRLDVPAHGHASFFVWVDRYQQAVGNHEGHLVLSSTHDVDTVAVAMTREEGSLCGEVLKIEDIWVYGDAPRGHFGYDTVGVQGAEVSCAGLSATSAVDGSFQIDGIEPGVHPLSVRDDRYVPFDTTVTVSTGADVAVYPAPILADYYPLQVGNRYVYHFRVREEHGLSYGSTGDEEWEIVGQDIVDGDTIHTVQVRGLKITWPWVDTLVIDTTRVIRQSGNRITIDVPKMVWDFVLCKRYYPAYSPEIVEVLTGHDYVGGDFDMWMRRGVGPSEWHTWGGHASDHWDYYWKLTDWTIPGQPPKTK
ncbi:MAG: fibronectin type III domain-containing protein [Candidatus Eisenbacteria bacterium]